MGQQCFWAKPVRNGKCIKNTVSSTCSHFLMGNTFDEISYKTWPFLKRTSREKCRLSLNKHWENCQKIKHTHKKEALETKTLALKTLFNPNKTSLLSHRVCESIWEAVPATDSRSKRTRELRSISIASAVTCESMTLKVCNYTTELRALDSWDLGSFELEGNIGILETGA